VATANEWIAAVQAEHEKCRGKWGQGGDDAANAELLERLFNGAIPLPPPDSACGELLAAAMGMDSLMENLWVAVPWGDTFFLDVQALNTAPTRLKQAIIAAGGTPAPKHGE
jgi:hypothetical protein